MTEPDFEGADAYALARLARELSPQLTYHSLAHTRDEVLPAAERLADAEGVSGRERELLRTAACFHDLGFVVGPVDHELKGIEIAQTVLPTYGFRPAHCMAISRMILATRIPQVAHTHLEGILADADLDVLGREDFWTRQKDLRLERAALGLPVDEVTWYRDQVQFLERHTYWTAAARSLRGPGKHTHIRTLLAHLQTLPV